MRWLTLCWLVAAHAAVAAPLDCRFAPPGGKRVLAELYSSEGCDACPPAERVFAGLAPDAAQVPIVWHVDYFDALGWKDRFALPESSRRQQLLALAQPGAKIVGTPQVYLDGEAFGVWRDTRALRSRVLRGAATASKLGLSFNQVERLPNGLRLTLQADTGALAVPLRWQAVLVQGGLRSQVTRGENQGLTLQHGHVVRLSSGPLTAPAAASAAVRRVQLQLSLPDAAEPSSEHEIGLVVWAEDSTGAVLNASWARCPW